MIEYTDAFVTLAASEFDYIVDFYTQLLGQKPAKFIPNVYAEFQLRSLKLGIFQPKKTYIAEFAQVTSKMSLCLEVRNLEDAIAHLTDFGYPPPQEIIYASHGKEVYAYDPDGNRIILHQSTNN